MRLGNGNWMLWAGAAASAAVVVILLVVLLPQRGNGEPGSTPTPSATATARPTYSPGPTLTAGLTSTSAATATARPTYTSGPTATADGTAASTSVPGKTATPRPTAIPTGGDSYAVYFTEASYRVSGEGQDFYTTINITPVELFFGAQFVLEWDCTLFQMRKAWTRKKGHGYLYNGSQWIKADDVSLNPKGENPQCPDPEQGRVNFLVIWDNYWGIAARGTGINVSREGTLVTVGWQTYSGADYREGVTGIRFVPTCKIGGYLRGSYEYTRPVQWIDTTVEVN